MQSPRQRLLWAQMLPQLQSPAAYVKSHADAAKDFHPERPALSTPPEAVEVLRPYVTIELICGGQGGKFGGVASTLKACVQGSVFKSDYADNGFFPIFNQDLEGATSHPALTLVRFCAFHRLITCNVSRVTCNV